jgi:hypothetical protein
MNRSTPPAAGELAGRAAPGLGAEAIPWDGRGDGRG